MNSTFLITGGLGFLGSNVARHALDQGHRVIVFDNQSRVGAHQNLEWLERHSRPDSFVFIHGDIRFREDLHRIFNQYRIDAVFHFASQVAMTTSLEDPYSDFQINAQGTLNLLDALRSHTTQLTQSPQYQKPISLFYSSTNKVYGDFDHYSYEETDTRFTLSSHPQGFNENENLDFRTPYGCSKGSADQMILDFGRRIPFLRTTVFRHSSMYGPRQFATFNQGWIGWFCTQALRTSEKDPDHRFTVSGNGKQVRDVLHSDDMSRLYLMSFHFHQKSRAMDSQAFNIGGGLVNSLSVTELLTWLSDRLCCRLNVDYIAPRLSDQKIFIADLTKIQSLIAWEPKRSYAHGLEDMLIWCRQLL